MAFLPVLQYSSKLKRNSLYFSGFQSDTLTLSILVFFGLRNSGGGHYVSPPALKPEKPSPRVNNGHICCLKS